jgi:hypothetical protein
MKKEEVRRKLIDYGDAIVTYRSEKSKKLKYNVVTLNFSTPYITKKRTHAKEDENTILAFSWDVDAFRLIKTNLITSIVPLSSVLRNKHVR